MSFIGSTYRGLVFGLWGLKDFTHAGFVRASKTFKAVDMETSLAGKSAIVTGANSGLGKVTALELARKGAVVHMVCRDPVAGERVRQELIAESQNPNIKLHLVDLSRPGQIKAFCQSFIAAKETEAIDILVNNAGVLLNSRQVTDGEGLEKAFATNTLGTYFMTTLLIPALHKSKDPRVITVSSGGMYNAALDLSDLQFTQGKYDGSIAYAQTKRAQVELTNFWAKKHPEILFVSMHPGWSHTPGVEKSLPGFFSTMKDSLRTPEEGADTIVWAANVKALKDRMPNGAFLFDRQLARQHLPMAGTSVADGLVDNLVSELDAILDKHGFL